MSKCMLWTLFHAWVMLEPVSDWGTQVREAAGARQKLKPARTCAIYNTGWCLQHTGWYLQHKLIANKNDSLYYVTHQWKHCGNIYGWSDTGPCRVLPWEPLYDMSEYDELAVNLHIEWREYHQDLHMPLLIFCNKHKAYPLMRDIHTLLCGISIPSYAGISV